MSTSRPAILATGSALPETIRKNDDPVFDWLRANPPAHQDLFGGYDERRVLAPGEQLADLMVEAATTALQRASVAATEVDVLLGYASVGTWEMPNDLVTVAQAVGAEQHDGDRARQQRVRELPARRRAGRRARRTWAAPRAC